MRRRVKRVHFVGIGGIGMSGIAEVLLNLGYDVSGSDLKSGDATRRLQDLGASVFTGHDAGHMDGADVVVTSSAVPADNPEVCAAQAAGIPVIPRGEMLAELMRMKYGVAITGTHGKTTTTSMVATLLAEGGQDPTAVIGGRLDRFGSNAKLGQGDLLVAEADESDGSFLFLSPTITVVTNIDPEHLEHYGSVERLIDAFRDFAKKVPFYGVAILCLDDPNVQRIVPEMRRRHLTYGLSPQADLHAANLELEGFGSRFDVVLHDRALGQVQLGVPGRHNAANALAAIAVALELDVPFETIRKGLQSYGGLGRRFERKGKVDGIEVIDDYGHHPTEIRATLAAARGTGANRIVAVFQPHRYSRTRDLFEDFMSCFNDADRLIMTEIYAASEEPLPGISGQSLFEGIVEHGFRSAELIPDYTEIAETIEPTLQEGDLVLVLGAGSISSVAGEIVERLKQQRTRTKEA